MRRLLGLLVFLVSSETVSESASKTVLISERGDLLVIRAIYFAVLCR